MADTSVLIIWMAWGKDFVQEAIASVGSTSHINASTCIITDAETALAMNLKQSFDQVVVADFEHDPSHLRKAEIWSWVPEGYDVYLFLDADTRVIGDISFGFEKAMQHGIAMVPAAHYCLDYFWGFDRIMKLEEVEPRGQLLYNSGVIFFTRTPINQSLFFKWRELANKYGGKFDQSYLTLAMELMNIHPYVLSPNYNYRGMFVPAIGNVRIWHSHRKMPAAINAEPQHWPMRYVGDGKLRHPDLARQKLKKLLKRLIRRG